MASVPPPRAVKSGDYTAPPEHCTDDIQTEVWTIRELY